MIISKNPTRVVATILAKNEADIIGRNIEHHLNQGVSQFIVTVNRCTDDTKEIVSRYKEVVEVIEAEEDDHRQSEWVTHMARLACKLKPDWIVHLDADELWCGLSQLRRVQGEAFGSTKMFLHPPRSGGDMSYYLDFEDIPSLPGECKIGHRPNPDVIVTHGNHGCNMCVEFTKEVWRHHYPIRSYGQLTNKTVQGHEALKRRNTICERWERWYNLYLDGKLGFFYDHICQEWEEMIRRPNKASLLSLLEMWSTPDVLGMFKMNELLPSIGQWPKE
jgi:hypothetical protein